MKKEMEAELARLRADNRSLAMQLLAEVVGRAKVALGERLHGGGKWL